MSSDQKQKLELKDRLPLTKVLGRDDGGEGLVGQTVGVAGWVRTKRDQGQGDGAFSFLELTDGTIVEGLQVVVVGTVPDYTQLIKQVHTGASLFVVGELVKPPVQSKQKVELKATEITVLGTCDPDKYPLAKKHHTLEHLRSIGHLRARTKTIAAVARIRSALAMATHEYFQSLGFIYLHTPLITASDCEGAGEMFGVTTILKDRGVPMLKDGKVDWSQDFFKRPAFLTVSGQLDAEIYATAISKVYTFGPTFRAENSNTTRHLAEFWMIEPEIAFADLAEDMIVAEGYIKHVLRHVLEKCASDMAFFEESEIRLAKEKEKEDQKAAQQKKGKDKEAPKPAEISKDWKSIPLRERIASVIAEPFAKVTYTEVIDILKGSGVQFTIPCPEWGEDLNSEHERYIAEKVYKKPVIITNYPKKLKAFYMRANADDKTVAAMDIVVPGIGEIIGGSQREERLDVLTNRIKELGLDEASYSWYLDLRRFGTVPHAGFGLGFERLVCYATGLENIRDAIPFPRFPGHAEF